MFVNFKTRSLECYQTSWNILTFKSKGPVLHVFLQLIFSTSEEGLFTATPLATISNLAKIQTLRYDITLSSNVYLILLENTELLVCIDEIDLVQV